MRVFFDIVAVGLVSMMLLSACSDPAEPEPEPELEAPERQQRQEQGRFQEDRVWPGLAEGKCGARLMVVSPDGSQQEYWPPEEFFQQFASQEIIQNESPRPAADLTDVMGQYAANSVRMLSCSGQELSLDKAMLAERPGLLVLAGRGLLKLVGEQDDQYFTVVRQIREIRFISGTPAADSPATSMPEDSAKAEDRNE